MDIIEEQNLRAAADNCGFNLEEDFPSPNWLQFVNTATGRRIWLSKRGSAYFIGIDSASLVRDLIGDTSIPGLKPGFTAEKPSGAADVLTVTKDIELNDLLFTIAAADPPLSDNDISTQMQTEYEALTRGIGSATEAERLTRQRIGQDIYRRGLIDYWHCCPLTGLTVECLLRASHIKPWAVATDAERLDIFNGFLFAPQIDLAFDQGFITFDDTGRIRLSPLLTPTDIAALGLRPDMHLDITPMHAHYLVYHREHIFHG